MEKKTVVRGKKQTLFPRHSVGATYGVIQRKATSHLTLVMPRLECQNQDLLEAGPNNQQARARRMQVQSMPD